MDDNPSDVGTKYLSEARLVLLLDILGMLRSKQESVCAVAMLSCFPLVHGHGEDDDDGVSWLWSASIWAYHVLVVMALSLLVRWWLLEKSTMVEKVNIGTQTVEQAAAVPDPVELYLQRYLAPDLRDMCRARGLPVGGLRDDLVRRTVLSPVRAACRVICTRAMAEMGWYMKADHRILHDEAGMNAWIDSATVLC